MERQRVVVIGGGPAGLATAGALTMRGIPVTVLERADVGHSWRGHYDRLHLHTTRRLSGLPGLPIPRSYGRWVARGDLVRYLESYRAHHRLDVRTGVDVIGLERNSTAGSPRWVVRSAAGEVWAADHVIVATGFNHTPARPHWPGEETFRGEIRHTSDYRNPGPFAGRSVLVVGTGNTGCEIAQDLAEGGAGQVWLAYRTPPHILRRDTAGWASQWTGIAVRRLPVRLVDRVAAVVEKASIPDLTAYGMPRPAADLYSRIAVGSIPVQDVGIVAAIQRRAVVPVPTPERFEGDDVVLRDGRRLRPDVVLVAAGHERGLEPLLGELGVLRPDGRPTVSGATSPTGAPGLWFNGYTNPISGMLREIRLDALAIAAEITAAIASQPS